MSKLSNDELWGYAVHEAAHGVLHMSLGLGPCLVKLHRVGGGHCQPWNMRLTEDSAFKVAVLFLAGTAATDLLLMPDERPRQGADADGTSDEMQVMRIALAFGGEQPDVWLKNAKDVARTLVRKYAQRIETLANRLMYAYDNEIDINVPRDDAVNILDLIS